MSDIFISYKQEERPIALKFATALEGVGWTVWWDLDLIGGEHFDDAIEAELNEAQCVVVLWSKLSARSRFVKDEATYALNQNKLLPARIDDGVLPFRFQNLHTIDLSGHGQPNDGAVFGVLIEHITRRIGLPTSALAPSEPEEPASAELETEQKEGPERERRAKEQVRVFRDTLTSGSKGPVMVVILGGTFWMGSPDSEEDRYTNESPHHEVTVPSFAMGQYAVTFDEYEDFCEAAKRDRPNDENWGRDTRPVINVNWDDAIAYTEWLSKETGKRYRLPSESEWEYAARAGTTTRYWWGDDIGKNHANCRYSGSQWSDIQTAPVGSFEPNPFDLYDTAATCASG